MVGIKAATAEHAALVPLIYYHKHLLMILIVPVS
jgi:hypothetical protein